MKFDIRYKPAFSCLFVTLAPGETFVSEAGAMVSMDAHLAMRTQFSGGFFSALMRFFFGGESLFMNTFTNVGQAPAELVISQSIVGDIAAVPLRGRTLCLQPGAFIACTPGVQLGVEWAGFKSLILGEGLFRLKVSGDGTVFFGGYGGITQLQVDQELVVDTGHLIAYEPALSINLGLVSGIVGSVTSGEGLVNRLRGQGTVYLQSRTIGGLVKFLRPKAR
ncbi:MAG: TIGR00266 family protein [Cyanothece sp. SIO1E1]|nr:TIGR00266 family protein [Cyanothece sp. SIO1E1]